MVASCFLKHGIPFQLDPNTRMLEKVNLMKMKYANQRFGLWYKLKKDDYRRVARIKKEARMERIKGRELE